MTAADLVLTGGHVVDPATGRSGPADLRLADGVLLEDRTPAADEPAARVLDCRGLYVVPGLIDLHTHVFTDGMEGAIAADVAGVTAGVTTVVDAGSSGPDTFDRFAGNEYRSAASNIVVFLNVARRGLERPPEVRSAADVDVDAAIDLIGANTAIVKGVKVRVVAAGIEALGLDLVRLAKRVAAAHGLPVMVHVGDPDDDPRCAAVAGDVLDLLEPGDILTHALSGRVGSLASGSDPVAWAREVQDRGVVLDIGHGIRNFSFELAGRLLDAGVRPDAVSTDMGRRPRRGPAYSMTETMSKLLLLGVPLEDVVAMATTGPADAVRCAHLGRLLPGRPTDVTLLRERAGRWLFRDSMGQERVGERGLEPVAVVRAGRVIAADWGPHPQGWMRPARQEQHDVPDRPR